MVEGLTDYKIVIVERKSTGTIHGCFRSISHLFFLLFEFRNGPVAFQHVKFFVEELKGKGTECIALCVFVFASPN